MQILTPSGYKDIAACSVGDQVVYYSPVDGSVQYNTILGMERYTPERFQTWVVDAEAQDEVPAVLAVLDEDGNVVSEAVDAIPAVAEEGHHVQDEFTFYRINGKFSLFRHQSVWFNEGRVCHAQDLTIGDVIYDENNHALLIESIEVDLSQTEWWRMTISGEHSYVADGLTLHNASRSWVSGTGNWDASTTTHWGSASGLADNASVPTSVDDVTTDTLSNATAYTITVTATANCNNLTFGAPLAGKVTWAGSSGINVYGNLNLSGGTSGITRTFTGNIVFAATSTGKTITYNGVATNSFINCNGAGGGWTLQDTFSNSATGNLRVTNGTLDTNGMTVTCGYFSANVSGTRTITLGASTLNCKNLTFISGITLNANTSTIALTDDGSAVILFDGLTYSFNDVTIGAARTVTMTGAASFHNLTVTGKNDVRALMTIDSSITVTNSFAPTGNSASNRLLIRSSVAGTARTITAAAVSLTDVDFTDITGAGAATWSGTRLGDAAGNSGITFATPADKFYVGNTNNWDATVWALTTGGAAAANNFPLPQDTAKLDAGSFNANGQTLTINAAFRLPNFVCSGTDQTYTLDTVTNQVVWYGTVTIDSNCTLAGTGLMRHYGRGTSTITSAGKTWLATWIVDSYAGGLVFGDNFTMGVDRALSQNSGTLDINGKVLTVGYLQSNSSIARTIKDGVGGGKIRTIEVGSLATVISASVNTNLTIDRTNSWTLEVGGNTTNTRIANLGAGTGTNNWPKITFTNTTANGELDVVSSGTATVVKAVAVSNPPQIIKRTAATTITIEDATTGMPSGTAGNLVTIGSITAAQHTWAGSSAETPSYLSISYSVAPSNWNAGATSTDGGHNSGWLFGTPTFNASWAMSASRIIGM